MIQDHTVGYDKVLVERVLLGTLPANQLNVLEKEIYERTKPRFQIGRLAFTLAQGYYSHIAAFDASKSSLKELLSINSGQNGPLAIGFVYRNDGSKHTFDLGHYLREAHEPGLSKELTKVWLVGSLLTLGDALQRNAYFNRDPVLELVRHLRNGVAHGNRFHITGRRLSQLPQFPAHNAGKLVITPDLQGHTVLFDFAGPAEILDLFVAVERLLSRLQLS